MRLENLKTKIFLDSGDPKDTKEVLGFLGFLDGQTTNPSLIASNPDAQARFEKGDKFSGEELINFYKGVVVAVSELIPDGSVSIEVYADNDTGVEEMLAQAKEMNLWVPNAHIKLPITKNGLLAAQKLTSEGLRVNMTLCFTQEQAAAVYSSTTGDKGDVFVSPFVGRLDDRGEDGMSLISNISKMYKGGDGHVEVLVASVRSFEHFLYSLQIGADIITAPVKILKEWKEKGLIIPDGDYNYSTEGLNSIGYKELDLNKNWSEFDLQHDLTDSGLERFASDWNKLIK